MVTSFYPVYVAALNVTQGVPGVEVYNLTNPHIGCLHDYQLSTQDMRRLTQADLLLANGAGMETFLEKVSGQIPGLRVVEVSEGIPIIDGNPHVWVSFAGARRQVENVAAALAEASPTKAGAFRANADAYNGRIAALEARARESLASAAGTPVVTFHESFPYLARECGLEIAGVVEGEPGAEPSAKDVAAMIRLVRDRRVKALFVEPQVSGRNAAVIAHETGAKVYELDPVVTGPDDPGSARDAWLQAMEKNISTLQQALH